MQIYYKRPNAILGWDEEAGCAYVRWEGFIFGEQFRKDKEKILEILKEKGASKELVNLQKARMLNQDDREWLAQNWVPRALAAGLKYTAFLLPQSELARASLYQIGSHQPPPESGIVYFDSEEEAREWLRSVN